MLAGGGSWPVKKYNRAADLMAGSPIEQSFAAILLHGGRWGQRPGVRGRYRHHVALGRSRPGDYHAGGRRAMAARRFATARGATARLAAARRTTAAVVAAEQVLEELEHRATIELVALRLTALRRAAGLHTARRTARLGATRRTAGLGAATGGATADRLGAAALWRHTGVTFARAAAATLQPKQAVQDFTGEPRIA